LPRIEKCHEFSGTGEVSSRSSVCKAQCERQSAGEELFANPRNTAAGSLKQLDPTLAPGAGSTSSFTASASPRRRVPETQRELLRWLKSLGFKTPEKHCTRFDR